MTLTLTSPAFADGGTIPKDYTADGRDVSPPLTWTDPPSGTAAFALVCDDPDAPRGVWNHWLLYDLPADCAGLPEGLEAGGELPDGSRQGTNDFRRTGYGGPSPPRGKPHRYVFTLSALAAPLGLPAGVARAGVLAALQGRVLAQAQLTGRYGR